MPGLRSPTFALVLGLLVAGSAAAVIDGPLTSIEGHVFNKLTGVPIEGAAVTITVFDAEGVEQGSGTGFTDSNGFYSSDVDASYFVTIEVSCPTRHGALTASASPPQLGPPFVRRDVYLDGPNKPAFSRCLPDRLPGAH